MINLKILLSTDGYSYRNSFIISETHTDRRVEKNSLYILVCIILKNMSVLTVLQSMYRELYETPCMCMKPSYETEASDYKYRIAIQLVCILNGLRVLTREYSSSRQTSSCLQAPDKG